MKKMIAPLFVAALLALPAVSSAGGLTVRNLDVSIGIHTPRPSVVYVDRQPDVVYVYDDDRHDRRHHRREYRDRDYREERRDRRRRDREPQVIVIDRDRGRRHCNEDRIVVKRPGTVVVMNEGRRW